MSHRYFDDFCSIKKTITNNSVFVWVFCGNVFQCFSFFLCVCVVCVMCKFSGRFGWSIRTNSGKLKKKTKSWILYLFANYLFAHPKKRRTFAEFTVHFSISVHVNTWATISFFCHCQSVYVIFVIYTWCKISLPQNTHLDLQLKCQNIYVYILTFAIKLHMIGQQIEFHLIFRFVGAACRMESLIKQ